jgi:preprotein translocase subunit SecE
VKHIKKAAMNAASEIEVGNKTPLDVGKVLLALVLVVGGFAFYFMAKQDDWVRWSVLLVAFALAALLFLMSSTGKSLITFFRSSYSELLRVVWSSRKETGQMTVVVFVFVVVMAIFLWAIDKTIEYTLFDLLLKWSK